MRNLSSVALCCVDTRTPALALKAMQRCMQELQFGDAILFAHPEETLLTQANALRVRIVDPGTMNSIEAYSRFMLQGLAPHLNLDFMLIVQWDGFVLNPECWSDDFFRYDYIGAVWPERFSRYKVGNGGFSLRSRKLLQALTSADIKVTHPEDLSICDVNRELLENRYHVRFAPSEIAARFAYEHVRSDTATFGFHGVFNLADALTPSEMLDLTKSIRKDMVFSAGMRALAKRLISGGQYESAQRILMERIRQGDRRWRIVSLLIRLTVRRWFGTPPDRLKK